MNARLNAVRRIEFKFATLILLIVVAGCSPDYGKKVVFNGTEIFYDGNTVKLEDAERLGRFLEAEDFTDGSTKSIQLVKKSDKWQFRMVIKNEYLDDNDYLAVISAFGRQVSASVFDGADVEIHLCDSTLNTKKVVEAADWGRSISADGTEIYFDGAEVTESDAQNLANYLRESGFIDGAKKSVRLSKYGNVWQFHMVTAEQFFEDAEFQEVAKQFASDLSDSLFNGANVEVHLCDEYFRTKKINTNH
ncbi:MAG TPA: hypothetical protein PKD64_09760 [Pirellulaceae bacterium]|nr:hypothetical protein [Pirellulaceae bacterium]HMO92471.1 hypothetical protein [Pirellulaceae bacterium]HMP67859.1 hypothetical protein [Pirellulaceae bacterium]